MTSLLTGKFRYKDAGALFLWAFLALQAIGFIWSFLPKAVTGEILFTGAINNLALLAVYFVYAHFNRVPPITAARITPKFKGTAVIAALLTVPILQYCVVGAMSLFDTALKSGGYQSVNVLTDVDFLKYGAGGLVGYILVTGILTAFCEELIFRGGVLQGLRDRMGDTAAIFVSAACFMIFHCSPDQTVFQFALGIMLALLTVRTGSILPAVILHAGNNILSIFMQAYHVSFPLPGSIGGVAAIAVVGVLVGLPLLTLLIDALSGTWKQNRFVVLFIRIFAGIKNKKAERRESVLDLDAKQCVEEKTELSEEPSETEDDSAVFEAAAERSRRRSERKTGTVYLCVGIVICAVIWIAQLVMGFTGGAV